MRLPLILAALTVSVPAASEAPTPANQAPGSAATSAVKHPTSVESDNCPTTRAHFANSGTIWNGEPVEPKNLDELPSGTAFMAVYRTINGCEMPMTVVEYRNGSRR